MNRLTAWWRRLPGSQQVLIAIGVPAAIIAALWARARGALTRRAGGGEGIAGGAVGGVVPVTTVGTGDLSTGRGVLEAVFGLQVAQQEFGERVTERLSGLESLIASTPVVAGTLPGPIAGEVTTYAYPIPPPQPPAPAPAPSGFYCGNPKWNPSAPPARYISLAECQQFAVNCHPCSGEGVPT